MTPRLDISWRRRVEPILQSEISECGLACLGMVAGFHGYKTDLAALRRRWAISLKGANLSHLVAMAQGLGLTARALRLDLEDIGRLRCPAILHWNMNHFVVLERVRGASVWIVDPAVGRRKLGIDEFSDSFTGVALELTPSAEFKPARDTSTLPLAAFFRHATGLAGSLARLLALSIALQVFLILSPLFGQIVIDEIVVSGDRNLLTVVAIAFLLLGGIRVCISGIRGWLVIALGASLRFGWSARLFHHLIRLPMGWFERRHVGDIVSRFGSLRAVEDLASNAVVEGIVDGMMAMTTLILMWYYNPMLAAMVCVAVLIYMLIRSILLYPMRALANESLAAEAREQSTFMESVRAILPLKVFGREPGRESIWQNHKASAINAAVRMDRLHLVQQIANGSIFAVESVLVLWIGALSILEGNMSIGMLVAFLAYKTQFTERMSMLIDRIIQFRLVRVHVDRIADIAVMEKDPGTQGAGHFARPVAGHLETRNLAFRYADTEPPVIAGLSLVVEPGECIAVTAPSGTGKSTLIKLMMGLLTPTNGEVLIDGIRLGGAALADTRGQMAAVMQDDLLLSGTLADNVSCFDPQVDHAWIEACAKLAAIDAEVARMPMGWSTLVGDMGSSLSGGQRQRILLARALYARPRILFLDEATSSLDIEAESRIHSSLREMSITRVMVTHRRETLSIADRVISLHSAYAAPLAP